MRIQTKTSILLISTYVIIITLFSGFVYYLVKDYSHDDFYTLLEMRAITTAKSELENNGETNEEILKLKEEFNEKLPNENEAIFLVDENEKINSYLIKNKIPKIFYSNILNKKYAEYKVGNVFYKGIKYNTSENNYIIIASAENYFENHHTLYLKQTLVIAIVISFIFLVLISLYISKYVFKPLTRITEKVKNISSEKLHLRLELGNNKDELFELTSTFNDMLTRIETAFESQNNFISNASHELKTPLTAIMGEADVTLSKDRDKEEYKKVLKIILEQSEKLEKKTQALLFLAQTAFRSEKKRFEIIRLDEILWDVKNTMTNINSACNINIDISLLPENPLKLTVLGNEQLLHLALSNVIVNACKYSDNSPIQVSIGASDQNVFIIVKDFGIGIPEDELKYIYDPFFRASNTKKYEGYGIGLPLTRNIVRMHKGELLVDSVNCNGTTVQIKIPNTYVK
jgi:signal transduction histidine kinase